MTASKQENEYSQRLKWESAGGGTLKSVVVAQHGEESQTFQLRAPLDFLSVQGVIS